MGCCGEKRRRLKGMRKPQPAKQASSSQTPGQAEPPPEAPRAKPKPAKT
jgi:hypothetical protein